MGEGSVKLSHLLATLSIVALVIGSALTILWSQLSAVRCEAQLATQTCTKELSDTKKDINSKFENIMCQLTEIKTDLKYIKRNNA